MKKENVFSRSKAQICVIAVVAALLLAAVLGVGITANAESSYTYHDEMSAGEYVRQQVGSEYTQWEQALTQNINVYCNGVVVKTYTVVSVQQFASTNSALLAKMYYFTLDLSSLKDNFYDFKLNASADAASVLYDSVDGTGLGISVAFLSSTGFNQNFRIVCSAPEMQPLPSEPVEEGYTFGGWYLDEEHTQPYEYDAIFGDITLYAKMNLNHYTIKYIVWDGEAAIAQNNVAHFSYLELPTSEERAGYIFVGWTNADGSDYDNTEYVKGEMTLYAKWERQKVKVTFKMPDGTVYKELTVAYGTKLVDAAAAAGVSTASFRAYYSDNVKLARGYEVVGNEVIEVKDMTKTEKTAAYISEHFWIFWTVLGVIIGLIFIAAISITVAVKRR